MGTRDSFSGVKVARTSVDHSVDHLAPRLRVSGATPPPSLPSQLVEGKFYPFFNEKTYKPSMTVDCSMTPAASKKQFDCFSLNVI